MSTPAAEALGICGVCFDVLHPKCCRQDWRPAYRAVTREEWEIIR